ncbi:MAG TPA: cyanate transporter [Alcaligenes sp.]|nr:cyanate transporter [Alcaligenes faecalis]HRL20301.1 cyanate transporter [Alcaligenes sp.]
MNHPAVTDHPRASRLHRGQGIWLAFVILVGLNLRPFLTSSGTLARAVSDGLDMALANMAWLTLLPMMVMGLGAFCMPSIRKTLSIRQVVMVSLLILCLGCALRWAVPNGASLIATALLCGAGVAMLQAVMPGIIKAQFPAHTAQVTGVYSATLMGGGALGAQITPLISELADSWRIALAFWALPIGIAMWIAWKVVPRRGRGVTGSLPSLDLLRRPRTWTLMLCFGLINGGYASLVTWLATFYQGHGWTTAASGALVALLSVAQAVAAFLMPTLAARNKDRRPWIWLALAFQLAGFAAFAYLPDTAPYLWGVIIGIGLGGCFSLVLLVALDHFPDAARAGTLSALMQGGGFPIAALFPMISAWLFEISGDFNAAWMLHGGLVVCVALLAWRFKPSDYPRVMRAGAARADADLPA